MKCQRCKIAEASSSRAKYCFTCKADIIDKRVAKHHKKYNKK